MDKAPQAARFDSIPLEERTSDVVVAFCRDGLSRLFGAGSDSDLGACDSSGDTEVMSVIKSCFFQSYVPKAITSTT